MLMEKEEFENIIREAGVAYQPSNELKLVETVRFGISKKTLLRLTEVSGISLKELSELMPVSLRTIQRYKDDDLLEPNVSERVLIIAEVLAKGMDVFGSLDKLRNWLHTPSVALGRRTPLSLLDTSFGARMVSDELGRLEHGVYS